MILGLTVIKKRVIEVLAKASGYFAAYDPPNPNCFLIEVDIWFVCEDLSV